MGGGDRDKGGATLGSSIILCGTERFRFSACGVATGAQVERQMLRQGVVPVAMGDFNRAWVDEEGGVATGPGANLRN